MNKKQITATLCIGVLVGILLGAYVQAQSSTTFTISSGKYPAGKYTVFRIGSTYYAKSSFGVIDYSGTNASQIINNAIQALSTSKGEIFISAGTYSLDISISAENGVDIRGEGINSTVLQATGDFPAIWINGKSRFSISNLKIIGGGKGNTDAYGIKMNNSQRMMLHDLFITQTYAGIYIKSVIKIHAYSIRIAGTGTEQNYYGIQSDWGDTYANDGFFNQISIYDTESWGVLLKGARGMHFNELVCQNTQGGGIQIGEESAGQFSRGNFFTNCVVDCSSGAARTTKFAVHLKQGSADYHQFTVFSACWFGGWKHGIYTNNMEKLTVTGCTFRDFEEECFVITSTSGNFSISDSSFKDWDRSGTGTFSGISLTNSYHVVMSSLLFDDSGISTNGAINETGTSDYNTFFGIDAYYGGNIYTVGANTNVNLSWNSTTWIP